MFDDIRLRPLCANGLNGQPECRSLIRAMQDMGWSQGKQLQYLIDLYADDPAWLREYMNKEQADAL